MAFQGVDQVERVACGRLLPPGCPRFCRGGPPAGGWPAAVLYPLVAGGSLQPSSTPVVAGGGLQPSSTPLVAGGGLRPSSTPLVAGGGLRPSSTPVDIHLFHGWTVHKVFSCMWRNLCDVVLA
jgi:hypothetical protein